jgi:trehalose-6-phosphate synthase
MFSGDDVTSGSATAQEPSEEEPEVSLEDVRNAKRKQRTRYNFICKTVIRENVYTVMLQDTYTRRPYGSAPRRYVIRIVGA